MITSRSRTLVSTLLLALVLGPTFAALAQQPQQKAKQPQVPPGVKVLRDLEYARVGEKKLLLDLYLPEKADEPLPLIIWVHGGGWAAGSKEQCGAIGQLQRGYAVASIGYRLSGEAIFPAQIEDCKAAVRWLRAHAKEFKLDAEHFGAWGSSAGGHLVALLGTSGGVQEFDVGDHIDQSSRVQAVSDFYGPTDLLQMDAHAPPGAQLKHDPAQSPESRLIGGPIQDNKEKVARANPIAYISPNDPPFLIVHGDQDATVPHHQSELLYDALEQAGLRVRFHTVEGGGHGVGIGGHEVNEAVNGFFDRHLKGIGSAQSQRALRTHSVSQSPAAPAGNRPGQSPAAAPGIRFEQVLAREDANHDGRVTREEFKGPPPLFDRLDRNRDGVLTKEDFAEPVAPNAQSPSPAPRPGAQPQPRPAQIVDGESRVMTRGNLEILTYETEEDFRKLEQLYDANRNAAPKPGQLTMQYFRSRTDGSVQPYALWLPRDFSLDRKFPLLVQLHGIAPKTLAGRRHTWQGMGTREWIDASAPVIVAQAFGRLNTFYQGIGEVDVLETIDEVARRCAVESDRVYLMGHSMGGAGSYTVGLHYPDRFGSLTPIDAAMWNRDESDLPDWMKPQAAMVHVTTLLPNARNVPVYFKNAGAGIQKNSTQFTDGIVAQGGFSTSESFPGMPHHFAPQMSYAMFSSQATLLPIKRKPTEVKFVTNTLRYNEAYWVTIDRLTRHNEVASVTANYDDGKPNVPQGRRGAPPMPPPQPRPPSLTVTTKNIDSLTLRLSDAGVPADAKLPLKIDGAELLSGQLPPRLLLSRASGSWKVVDAPANTAGKRHGVQGPIGDAFNSRFLAVYGEGDRDLAISELDAIRNPRGNLVIHGDFPMKAADKVTAEDIQSSNLILFGTPQSNSILGRLAPKLPRPLVAAIDKETGVVFVYPNPENPERYIVVWTAAILSADGSPQSQGFIQPLNLLPDFVHVKQGQIVSAGYFNGNWRDDVPPQAVEGARTGTTTRGGLADQAAASLPTGLLFFASYPERDNIAAATNPHILGALHTIYWSNVEPSEGKFDWSDIDQRISRWTSAGKKVALRIMWSSSGNWPEPAAKHPTPQWVLDKGAVTVHSDSSRTDIPLVWDPIYRKYAGQFLKEVARKFDGDPNILFLDVTPGAETNPYRFRRINVQEPEFKTRFAQTPASDGRKYSHELWLETVKQAVDDAAVTFKKTKLLVTLNIGSLDGPIQMQAIGDHCVSRGCYVGQNGLRGTSYAKDSPRASPFVAWGQKTQLYFEMLDATSQGTTGTLLEVMQAAERIGCDYLGVYSADVLKGTPGQPGYNPEYERALKYGAEALGKQSDVLDPRLPPGRTPGRSYTANETAAVLASGAKPLPGFKLDGERWTYKDDTLSMQGILLKPEGKGPFPAILISHGLGGNAQAFGLSKARELVKWDLVCIACDYAHAGAPGKKLNPQGPERTNYGASEENLRRASKCLDILASLPEVDSKRLCAYGHSMGGFVTIGLAANEPDRLRAAAISGSGVAPRAGFAAPSVEAAGKIKTPFIIFHGDADNTVRPAQSLSFKEVLDKSGVANERHVFEGVGHPVDQEKRQEVFELMQKWFQSQGVL